MVKLQSNIPEGPLAEKWSFFKSNQNLVNPANKRKLDVIVVGTGLAGAAAAASMAEMGFKVKSFCYQDSPRRAHSIAAQGGINAAKNYQNDGDSGEPRAIARWVRAAGLQGNRQFRPFAGLRSVSNRRSAE